MGSTVAYVNKNFGDLELLKNIRQGATVEAKPPYGNIKCKFNLNLIQICNVTPCSMLPISPRLLIPIVTFMPLTCACA